MREGDKKVIKEIMTENSPKYDKIYKPTDE